MRFQNLLLVFLLALYIPSLVHAQISVSPLYISQGLDPVDGISYGVVENMDIEYIPVTLNVLVSPVVTVTPLPSLTPTLLPSPTVEPTLVPTEAVTPDLDIEENLVSINLEEFLEEQSSGAGSILPEVSLEDKIASLESKIADLEHKMIQMSRVIDTILDLLKNVVHMEE